MAFSQTPAKAAGAWTRSRCVAWCVCLLLSLRWYQIILLGDRGNVCEQLLQGSTRQCSGRDWTLDVQLQVQRPNRYATTLAVFSTIPVVDVTCNLWFHGKSRTAALWHPKQDSTAEITLKHGHVWSLLGKRATSFAPNVPKEHRDYTNLHTLMTAGSPLVQSSPLYLRPRVAGRRDPDALLDTH